MITKSKINTIRQFIIRFGQNILKEYSVHNDDWSFHSTSSHLQIMTYDKSIKFSFFFSDFEDCADIKPLFEDFEYFVKFFRNDKRYKNSKTCLIDKLELIGK